MHNITPEDLVQFLYKETSKKQTADIQAALENDWTLREMFEAIKEAHQTLEPAIVPPREEVIEKILRYAATSMGELHHH